MSLKQTREKHANALHLTKMELPFDSSSFKERCTQRTSARIWSKFWEQSEVMLPMQKKEGRNMAAKWNCFFRNKRKCLAKQNR